MAAVLACGDGALLSHRAAAVLWGIRPPPIERIDVLVTTASGVHSRPGYTAHRASRLHPDDATRRDGVPVTSPARTLLDLAADLSERELARAVEQAQVCHLVTDGSLYEQCSRYPRHPGARALRHAIRPEPALTRSAAERRLLELIRAARLPEPHANTRIGAYEGDLVWPEAAVVVEVDGYAFHSTRAAFERDRRRDAELQTMGYRVFRVTWRQIADEPEALVATLALATASESGVRGRTLRGGGRARAG